MSEYQEDKIEKLYVEAASEVTLDDAHEDPETLLQMYNDEAAVRMVLDDATQADNFMNINQWSSLWVTSDVLYQSPSSMSSFDGGTATDTDVPKYTISNHMSAIVPKLMGGIFYEDPPFLLRPRPNTDQAVIDAKTALFSQQLEQMKFEEEVERTLEQMALLGTGIMKWGYREYKENVPEYRRKGEQLNLSSSTGSVSIDSPDSDDFEEVLVEKTHSHPWIKYCDIRTVLVDPGCRYGDIRRAKWVIYRDYPTYDDLSQLRGQEGWDIPEEETLKQLFMVDPTTPGPDNITMTLPEGMRGYIQHALPRNFKTSADPLQNGLEILERWDNDKVIVVLSHKGHNILIRNEENTYRKIPFYSANWRNIPDNFYGQGLGQLIGAEQVVEQGITNLSLGLLAYGLQPTAVKKRGFNNPTQSVRWKQGGIIEVDDDIDKSFKFLTMPPVPSEAWQFIQQAQSTAAATSGANEQVVQGAGHPGVSTTGMRSGTGAAAVVQANASRLDGPDSRLIRQIFEPWLYQMDALNNRFLPTAILKEVLGEELGNAFQVDQKKFRNAKLEFEVLAGAHLGPKKEMAQFLPLMIQMVDNPTIGELSAEAGYMWNIPAIIKAMSSLAGWKYTQDFYTKMTPEQQQKRQQNSPAALQQQKLQAANQSQLQQFQQEEKLEDQKQLGKAGAEVLRQTTQHALDSEELNGVPGNTGFGSETAL